MTEHDPALVEKAARAIACGWCHATNHEQCREWNKPVDTLHSTRLYDARAVLDAVAPAIREAAQREHRIEWADYIANWGSAVGPEPPTVWSIVEALRAESLPFGRSAGDMSAQQRQERTDGR